MHGELSAVLSDPENINPDELPWAEKFVRIGLPNVLLPGLPGKQRQAVAPGAGAHFKELVQQMSGLTEILNLRGDACRKNSERNQCESQARKTLCPIGSC